MTSNLNAVTRAATSFSNQNLDYYLNLYLTSKRIDLVPLATRKELISYFQKKAELQKASMESTSLRLISPSQSRSILDEYEKHINFISQSIETNKS